MSRVAVPGALLLVLLLPLARAPGVAVIEPVVNVYAGVLMEGRTDAYPNGGVLGGSCVLPAVGPGMSLYLVVPKSSPGDRVILWTHEDFLTDRHVPHEATGNPLRAYAFTYDFYFGCANFEVEARHVLQPVSYVVVACKDREHCPVELPLPSL